MLYTKKEIEKIYSNLIVDYINQGARIDFDNSNYLSGQFDNHVDLIAEDGCRIIIYTETNRENKEAFRGYNRGLCEIIVDVIKPSKSKSGRLYYPESNAEKYVAYTFYRFKEIYTDSEGQYNKMVQTERERMIKQFGNENNSDKVKYNPSVVLHIIRKRKGFKRTKTEDIVSVRKRNGIFMILINTGKKRELITIG